MKGLWDKSRNTIVIALLMAELAWFNATIPTILVLIVAAFWLVILPGSLVLSVILHKSLREWETWVFGAALGVNILPIVSLISSIFTPDATIIWPMAAIAISLANVVLLVRIRRRTVFSIEQTAFPFAELLLVLVLFLGVYQFQQFGRDASRGVYYFSAYFGGDMGLFSSMVNCFAQSTYWVDRHTGGISLGYHDATFRLLGGLRFFAGGNVYDTTWFFAQPFDFLLLFSCLWLITFQLTKSRLSAWIAVLGLLLFDNASKLEIFFTTISDSYRLGLVQGILAIYLLIKYHSHKDRSIHSGTLLLIVLAMLPRWKVTGVMVLVPAMVLMEIHHGWKKKEWSGLLVVSAGFAIALIHAFILFAPSIALAGESVVGRPLLRVKDLGESILLHRWKLHPAFPLSAATPARVFSFLYLLPFYLIGMMTDSMRLLLIVFVYPFITKPKSELPELPTLLISAALLGQLLPLIQSPMHYVYGDAYQPMYGYVIASIGTSLVMAQGLTYWFRSRSKRYMLPAIAVLLAILIEMTQGIRGYRFTLLGARGTVPIALIEELQTGGAMLPRNALVATRRYDLTNPYPNAPLAMHPNDARGYHDRNFMFYATGLERSVVLEGVADALMLSGAIAETDSVQWYLPNEALRSILIKRSAWLDSIYDSNDPSRVIAACDSLGVSHILIDRSIGQYIRASGDLRLDTLFSGLQLTLVKAPHAPEGTH